MSDNTQNSFIQRLINLRDNRNWSKTEVARKLGLSSMQRYANYEYGTNEPDSNMLKQIADLYDVTTYLVRMIVLNGSRMTYENFSTRMQIR